MPYQNDSDGYFQFTLIKNRQPFFSTLPIAGHKKTELESSVIFK
jgi:hypothetical protein